MTDTQPQPVQPVQPVQSAVQADATPTVAQAEPVPVPPITTANVAPVLMPARIA
jgi:hypothetical protein